MMTRKERFLTAVRGGQPDRVPMFDFLFQQPMYEELIGRRPGTYNVADAVALALALEHDAVWLPFGGFNGFQPQFLDANTYIDEWGTTFRHNDSSWPIDAPIDYPIQSRHDLACYRPPDPTWPGRASQLEAFWQTEYDQLALTGGVSGPFTTCWMLMGYEQICYALYDDPTLLTEIFRISNDYNKEAARLSVAAGCHALWISDDLGDSCRGFLKLDHFRRFYLPYLAELTDYVDSLGVPVLLHCCGPFHRLSAGPGPDEDRVDPPAAAHRRDGSPLGQGALRAPLLHHRQHRFLAHPPVRHSRRGRGGGPRGHRHRRAGRRLCPGLRSFAARRHPRGEYPGAPRRRPEIWDGGLSPR